MLKKSKLNDSYSPYVESKVVRILTKGMTVP